MNEPELIISIQNGDFDSFRKRFDLYKSKAVRTAYHITGSQAAAEDVAQEAFVKCYFEIGAYSGTSGRRFRKHPDTKPEVSGHFAG